MKMAPSRRSWLSHFLSLLIIAKHFLQSPDHLFLKPFWLKHRNHIFLTKQPHHRAGIISFDFNDCWLLIGFWLNYFGKREFIQRRFNNTAVFKKNLNVFAGIHQLQLFLGQTLIPLMSLPFGLRDAFLRNVIINDAIQAVDDVFLICIGVADEIEIVVRKRQCQRNNSVRFDMASLIAVVDANGSMQESIFRKVPDQIHQVFILKIA